MKFEMIFCLSEETLINGSCNRGTLSLQDVFLSLLPFPLSLQQLERKESWKGEGWFDTVNYWRIAVIGVNHNIDHQSLLSRNRGLRIRVQDSTIQGLLIVDRQPLPRYLGTLAINGWMTCPCKRVAVPRQVVGTYITFTCPCATTISP